MNLYNQYSNICFPFVDGTVVIPGEGVSNPDNLVLDFKMVVTSTISEVPEVRVHGMRVIENKAFIDIGIDGSRTEHESHNITYTNIEGYATYVFNTDDFRLILVCGSELYTSPTPMPPNPTGYLVRNDCIISSSNTEVSKFTNGGNEWSGDIVVRPGVNTTVSTKRGILNIGISVNKGIYECDDPGVVNPSKFFYTINGVEADDTNNINISGGVGVAIKDLPEQNAITIKMNPTDECC